MPYSQNFETWSTNFLLFLQHLGETDKGRLCIKL